MLTPHTQQRMHGNHPRQKGVVLLITLIMLVAMTLAAIALMRSVDNSNLVAGNLAFQQTSMNTADVGTEQALRYLYNNVTNLSCDGTIPTNPCVPGYKSFHQPCLEPSTGNPLCPVPSPTWEKYWEAMVVVPGVVKLTGLPAGYDGAFVIEAMCSTPQRGQTGTGTCFTASTTTTTTPPQGQDMGSNIRNGAPNNQTVQVNIYRITTRVTGPRNSVAYVQAMIAAQ